MSSDLPEGLTNLPSLCRVSEFAPIFRLGKSTVWAMTARGEFPSPRKISNRHTAWLRSDLERWFLERPRLHGERK